jgi:hypothetical protein
MLIRMAVPPAGLVPVEAVVALSAAVFRAGPAGVLLAVASQAGLAEAWPVLRALLEVAAAVRVLRAPDRKSVV